MANELFTPDLVNSLIQAVIIGAASFGAIKSELRQINIRLSEARTDIDTVHKRLDSHLEKHK